MPNAKLDHCVIHVSHWDRSNAFYRDVLGADLIRRGAGWAYRFGDTQLNCHGPGVAATPVARLPVQPGNSDLCFVWPGPIEEAAVHLARHGGRFEDRARTLHLPADRLGAERGPGERDGRRRHRHDGAGEDDLRSPQGDTG